MANAKESSPKDSKAITSIEMIYGLEIRETQEKGAGVFATKHFEKGELIECCRVIVVPRTEILIANATSVLRHYVIDWDGRLAIPTGYGCFYNHSYTPNVIHQKHLDLHEMHFHALNDIAPFEELMINYGGFPACKDQLWFEVK